MTETQEPYNFKEVTVIPPTSPMDVLMAAINKGLDVSIIEKMMDLQERHERNEARKSYVSAMAKFKANPPEILKTAHVQYEVAGKTVQWDHAKLGEITEAISQSLSSHGLYAKWSVEQSPGLVKTTCTLTHELGHSESVTMEAPPDNSGGKDAIKAMSSTNTILQRLTLLAVTGLAAKGMDRESGGDTGGETITNEQAQEIKTLIDTKGVDEKKFLEYMKVESVFDIQSADFKKAMTALNKAKGTK